MRRFVITDKEQEKLDKWKVEQDAIAYQKQVSKGDDICAMASASGKPYCGAIGGSLTFSFTPTGLGDIASVKHNLTDDVLELTDVSEW